MKKIGIFGGTFNPPHTGHLHLAQLVAKTLELDKVLIIPDNMPPHKIPGSLVSGEHRLNMCRLTFSDSIFEISPMEIERGSKSYTVDTLHELKAIYPDDEFYFIAGSDMLQGFTKWYHWEEILTLSYLAVASRERGFEADLADFTDEQKKRIIYIESEPLEVSSSEIRSMIRSEKDCGELLTSNVKNYIKENNLYDDGLSSYRKILSGMLDEKRLFHSECVCESAGDLAEKYGADVSKARLAGLLHDITKQLPEEKQRALIGEMTPLENSNYKVWHQMSAPVFLKNEGIIRDEEILSAIRWHTTGKAGMTLLEKIVYTADFISSDRNYPDVDAVRKLAYISLEHAMLYTSRYTIESLVAKDRPVHPETMNCYNDILRYFGL